MNNQEALQALKEGKAIRWGGYTFLNQSTYLSYGTYPGCVRAGIIANPTKHSPNCNWEIVTERDIVLECGYAYDVYSKPVLNDGTVDFDNLRKFLEKNLTVENYKNPEINSKYCKLYFNLEKFS